MFWSGANGAATGGFSAAQLPQWLHLFSADLQVWLADALDEIRQMEEARLHEDAVNPALPIGLTVAEEP